MRSAVSPSFARDLDARFQAGALCGLSDPELLARFTARRDAAAERAFEAIVHRHGPMVWGVCRRAAPDEPTAEDAFQATFLVLAIKAGSIRRRESLGPWLHGVAARIARRARVRASRRARESLEPRLLARLPAPEAEAELDSAERRAVLDEEIERLPSAYRRAIVLCYLEGKTQEAAARELGWSKGTVPGRLARARDRLRARLIRRGLAPSAEVLATPLATRHASAGVPAAVASRTIRAGLSVALGRGEGLAGSGPVAALARRALRAMVLSKIIVAWAGLLTAVLFAAVLAQADGRSAAPGRERHQAIPGKVQSRPASTATTPDVRGHDLPPHARARLGMTRLRHSAAVYSIDFAPDGRAIASIGGLDAEVRSWDRSTGQLAASSRAIPLLGMSAYVVAYSPDGTKVAIGGDGLVRIWDLVAGKESARSAVHPGRVFDIAFTPDGRAIATTGEGSSQVRIWDVATGRLERALSLDVEALYAKPLAFSRDGKRLAMGGTPRMPGGGSRTPDGDIIGIWDLDRDGEPLIIRKAHEGWLSSLAFTPEGTLISCGCAFQRPTGPDSKNRPWEGLSQIRIWDATSGRKIKDLIADTIPGMCRAAWSRDGRTLVSSHRDRLLAWEMPTGKLSRVIPVEDQQDHRLYRGVAVSPDGRLAAALRGDQVIHLWDVATGRRVFADAQAHDTLVYSVAISPDGRLVATGDDSGTIRLWDPGRGETRHRLRVAERGRIWALRFAPGGRALAAAFEEHGPRGDTISGVVRIWDLPVLELRRELRVAHRAVQVEFSPDGRRVAIASWDLHGQFNAPAKDPRAPNEDTIGVFEVATGKKEIGLPGHDKQILAMAFGPDGRTLASAGQDNAIRIWDLTAGRVIGEIPIEGHRNAVPPHKPDRPTWIGAAALSADLKTAVSSRWFDDRLLIWDLRSGRVRRTIQAEAYDWNAMALSPDGRLLAWAMRSADGKSGSSIRILEANTKRERLRLQPGAALVLSLAFSADGKTLVSGMADTTAIIWDCSAAYATPANR